MVRRLLSRKFCPQDRTLQFPFRCASDEARHSQRNFAAVGLSDPKLMHNSRLFGTGPGRASAQMQKPDRRAGAMKTCDEIWKLSAVEISNLVRERKASCVEVMESVLGRIAAHNGELNAIVLECGETALQEARRKDREQEGGSISGPLHGVPVTVKVNVDVAGQATTNGLPSCRELIASEHSPVVDNLLKAGAIVVGRTNTPEFSMRLTTDNPLHGRTFNPWDRDVSPGGSSGGAAAAAAMGFGPIHHGNDIGGSLRMPSFACGVATVKPTFGRVPAHVPSAIGERGILAQLIAVQGAICREVRDVRLATRALAQGDPRDPWWVPAPFDGPRLDEPVPVAVTSETYGCPAHPDIIGAIDQAAGILDDAGYRVERIATPPMNEPARAWFDVLISELSWHYGPSIRETGSETIRQIFSHYERIGKPVDAVGYRRMVGARTALLRDWNMFLDRYPLVLCPFLLRPTHSWDHDAQGFEEVRDLFSSALYSTGVNYLSLPAGVVPIGYAAGLPAGVQIIGRRFREDLILDAMETIERSAGVLAHELWARQG